MTCADEGEKGEIMTKLKEVHGSPVLGKV